MKKIGDFVRKSLLVSLIGLGIFYLHWFYFFPIDEPFYFVPFIFAVFVVIVVLLKLSGNNKIMAPLLSFFAVLVLAANIFYSINFYPRTLDTARLGDVKYAIASTRDMDNHLFMFFFKCNKWGFNCSGLYGSYSWEILTRIVVDKTKNEVSIIEGTSLSDFSTMTFTDGEKPREYARYTSAQLRNHLYFLSKEDNVVNDCKTYLCDSYTYILYECSLDYTLCNPLPIQYTESYEAAIYLDANEITNEINAHDNYDEKLIFTYGEHPHCYVEGCEILK